jgi:hypothetical protein
MLEILSALRRNSSLSIYALWKEICRIKRKSVYFKSFRRHLALCMRLGLVEVAFTKTWHGKYDREAQYLELSQKSEELFALLSRRGFPQREA